MGQRRLEQSPMFKRPMERARGRFKSRRAWSFEEEEKMFLTGISRGTKKQSSPPKLGGVPFARFSANGGVVPEETTPSAPASVASRHFLYGAATPPDLGVSRTVLLAGPITERKSAGRKQRTYRPTSLRGELSRLPIHSHL